MNSSKVVAVFDFDHTLTTCDSLVSFLCYAEGYIKSGCYLALLCPVFVRFLIGKTSRQEVKEKILTQFFRGRSMDDLQALGNAYAEQQLDRYLQPKAMQCLQWHREQGHL